MRISNLMKVSLLGASFTTICCTLKKTEHNNIPVNQNDTISQKFETTRLDTCSYCNIDPLIIKANSVDLKPQKKINYPIAIEFFNNSYFISKYERINYDTVMKRFKMKSRGDRNKIYYHYDLYGYYSQGIKPALKKYAIVIDSLIDKEVVEFIYQKERYVVDLKPYKNIDGVVMFNPGRKPIFWTIDSDWESCNEYYVLPKWYFMCH